MRTGVALLNFGGPWTLADVKPFLYRLFSNPAVLVGLPSPLRQLVAKIIAEAKASSSIECYRQIGGGSPQLMWTEVQADGLKRLVETDDVHIEIGMRSATPTIESALTRLKEWGAERVILLPLFPHYSTTTSGTCFEEAAARMRRMRWNPYLHVVNCWPDHPLYINLLRRTIDEKIAEASGNANGNGDPVHVLFSAHSLPMKIVRRGDPYPKHVLKTITAVSRDLEHPWSLSFQSRNGRTPWLEPYTEDVLRQLGQRGVKRVVVVPVSFVSDHIETLWELDMLYKKLANEAGIEHYYRARAFNDDPAFAVLLRSLLQEAGI